MAEEQQFCLRWNNFQVNITSQFEALRDEEDFVDVTLACEGKRLKAHKVVLSACSPYFKDLFKSNPCKHPILFMRDVEFRHLQSLVEFMYAGEVNVAQAQLSSFLRTAESLQIRGLTEAPQRHKQLDGGTSSLQGSLSTSAVPPPQPPSPGDNSHANASSPEGEADDDDVLSISPPNSPPPAKRACREPEQEDMHSSDQLDIKNEAPDILEPKLEAPDYSSDGESKTDSGAMSGSFMGLDNSVDMNTTFAGLHSGMEILPGTSTQNFMGESSQDSTQADQRKLHSLDPRPCPICYRMYSNLSNLRQHLRLIHNPQTVACPLCSKPFKTKLYLKRHLMSFHELLCTSPKSAVPPPTAKGPPEFYPPPPQIVLGEGSAGTVEKNGFPTSPAAKSKDQSPQDPVVAEYFQQTRGGYQSSAKNNNNNNNISEERASSFQENHQEVPPYQNQALKDSRAAFLNPCHVRYQQQDSSRFRVNQQQNQSPKSQDMCNYLNTLTAPANNERVAQYVNHPQSTGGQDNTPPFLNLLSLAKSGDDNSFLNSMQSHSNEQENSTERETNDSLNSN